MVIRQVVRVVRKRGVPRRVTLDVKLFASQSVGFNAMCHSWPAWWKLSIGIVCTEYEQSHVPIEASFEAIEFGVREDRLHFDETRLTAKKLQEIVVTKANFGGQKYSLVRCMLKSVIYG